MGNALKEELEGRVVIIGAKHLIPALSNRPELRAFRVTGGFGASPHTRGNAIFGKFLFDGEYCRIEGWMVNRYATEKEIKAAEAILEGAKS